jgi:SpoIVB peptidase S55
MPLSQIHKGMKGYGVTAFEGTKLERFDVEILGVLNHIGPDQDLILARISHPTVTNAGVIAGMSGSPVYIDGKVIGALAYSWGFSKEPIAGITPIEEMLKLGRMPSGSPAGAIGVTPAAPRMSGAEFLLALANGKTAEMFEKMTGNGLLGSQPASGNSGLNGARQIAVPLSFSSFSPDTVNRYGKYIDALGFLPVPSGAASSSVTPASDMPTKVSFQPGDPIAGVLLRGDFTVAATGTVTHVEGDRVWAFGHPFMDMGEISFPMATSEIVAVMPSLQSSFKFSNTGATVGALKQDRSAGILGITGATADTIPVELSVESNGQSRTYNVEMVRQAQLSPLLLAMATDSVVSNVQKAAGERTIILDSEIDVKGFAPIHLREGWAGAQARQSIPSYLAVVAGYLLSNEFNDAQVERVKLHLRHDDDTKIAKLLEVSVDTQPDGQINPGDTLHVRTVLKPFRGEPFTEMFDVQVPDNQEPGQAYLLVSNGSMSNAVDFSLVPPDPRTLAQVVGVLERLRPSTDLTLGLYSAGEGAVTAGVYLPNLPPSIRAVVSNDTSNGASAPVKYHAPAHVTRSLGYIVDGMVKIDLDVKAKL